MLPFIGGPYKVMGDNKYILDIPKGSAKVQFNSNKFRRQQGIYKSKYWGINASKE